eukprot:TRINITY_DN1376_c0_g1_i6.p2 TRINITY_DN1376_c0_g1~~TRINITY_DN1376_c0_g1_i6.p2  ORF type:complete len:433 (-),score=95.18 TRINITY_DN1376_c0_g1_i6:205-1503(-)
MSAPASMKALQVCIQHAQMLPNVDGFLAGKSDPYVICHIPGKKTATFQTPVVQDNLNPQWNHTELIHDYSPEDSLEFQVWDKNNFPMPDKKIGHVTLGPADFAANPYGMEGELQLEDCKAQEATLAFQVHVLDDVDPNAAVQQQQEVLQPQTVPATVIPAQQAVPAVAAAPTAVAAAPTSKLRVEILNAKMLPNKDSLLSGKSDPYVIAQVPGTQGMFHGKTKITTPVINNNLNPEWNFTGDIPHFKPTDVLEFEVWDQDSFPKPDQLLGKTQLNPEDFAANPGGLEGELPLTGTQGEDAGTLAIRVHVLPDDAVGTAAPGAAAVSATPAVQGTPYGQQVQIGSSFHGGILVSEHWNPPVPTGFVRPSVMPPVTPRFAQGSHVPMATAPHGVPMMSIPQGFPMTSVPYGVPMTSVPYGMPAVAGSVGSVRPA